MTIARPIELRCPTSRQSLSIVDAESLGDAEFSPAPRISTAPRPIGLTARVALRADGQIAYPVNADAMPVLLSPEALHLGGSTTLTDLTDPRYAEAYEEMTHYDSVAAAEIAVIATSESGTAVAGAIEAAAAGGSFPEPVEMWLDATFDASAQEQCYRYLADRLAGGRVLQVGGKGIHAVKFLLAGADEAWVASPMPGELLCARALAEHAGVRDRIEVTCAIGEELPFADASFDAIYVGGSLHHMVVDDAAAEFNRVLRPGGRFAAVEPWRAPLYTAGTRLLGKREQNVHCQPLDDHRVGPATFRSYRDSHISRHGALSRYVLIAASKAGWQPTIRSTLRVMDTVDRALPDRVVQRFGSSVALLAES